MIDKKRMWFVTVLIIIIGFLIGIFLSNQKETIKRRPTLSRQRPIKLLTVKNENIQLPVEITGPLYAYNKVELYAEVSGVLQTTPKRFKEGYRYSKGNVLIQIDDSVYKNNLLAEKSGLLNQLTLLLPDLSIDFPKQAQQWETYLKNLDIQKPLKPLPPVGSDKERYYIASRNIYNQYYKIKSMEATFAKYTLRAPFNGIVTESSINPGTLVRVGQKLGEFSSTELYEMEAAVNIFDANQLEVGMPVKLDSEDIQGVFEGRIQRINSVINRETMRVKVYVHISDPRLREGMYLNGRVKGNPIPNAFTFSMDLLVGHNHVYTVEDSVLVSKRITIVSERGGKVIVRGLADGTKILGEVWEEAKDGVTLPKVGSKKDPGQVNPERHSQ